MGGKIVKMLFYLKEYIQTYILYLLEHDSREWFRNARMTINMIELPQSGQRNWCFGKVIGGTLRDEAELSKFSLKLDWGGGACALFGTPTHKTVSTCWPL